MHKDKNSYETALHVLKKDPYDFMEFDLPKLVIGQVYTYKQLTDLLQIPYYSGGNQKERQLNLLKRFINLTKNKHWYKVNEIYKDFSFLLFN